MSSSPTIELSTAERRVGEQIDAATNLARFGAEPLARDLCAAVFLQHPNILLANRSLERRFVECLLRLGMTNLLARHLRAAHGVELATRKLSIDGVERIVLALSNGSTVSVPVPELRADPASVGGWSEKVLTAADRQGEGWVLAEPPAAAAPEHVERHALVAH